jgi:hypothetical protein
MNNASIEKLLAEHEDRIQKLEAKLQSSAPTLIGVSQKQISPKEFLLEKKPSGEVQKTLILCYYIEHTMGLTPFNIDDLNKVFKLAKEAVPSNLNDKINKNIDKGYLVEDDEKKDAKKAWHLTASGENFINQIEK